MVSAHQPLTAQKGKDGASLGFYLPDEYTDIILGISKGRNRGDACTHCYFTVDLNEP